ncbi:glycosyltransferase [Phenylobacterium sp.]|uniref:glycosyltransferase n=1 Tax=Phenylobacterium sp. TaxID=1871053 RepID=UPI0039830445
MRILFVVHQFMPDYAGGTEKVTLNLARAAQAEGHGVEVLTVTHSPETGWKPVGAGLFGGVVEGVPVTAIAGAERPLTDLGFAANPALTAATERFLASRAPFDVAHVTHGFRMTEAVEVLAARRVPYLVTVTDFFTLCYRLNLVRLTGGICSGPQGGEACKTWCRLHELAQEAHVERTLRYERLLRQASAVVAVSDYVAGVVRGEYPGLAVRVVNNGVDLLNFQPRAQPRAAGPLTIGYLGTVSEAKGALMLTRAFAASGAPNARLRIVGPCYDEAVAAEIGRLGEACDISLEGPVGSSEIGRMMGEFDVLAVPSQVPESFCLSLYEGFAAGLPALVSDLGNPGAVIAATGAGRALAAHDPAAWAQAITELAADPSILATWAARAPLPNRMEEEGFLYGRLYRAAATPADAARP